MKNKCEKCGYKSSMKSLFSKDRMFCRYCSSNKPKKIKDKIMGDKSTLVEKR